MSDKSEEKSKRLLVAINGSDESIHAAMYAVMLARTYKAEIKFLYVIDAARLTAYSR